MAAVGLAVALVLAPLATSAQAAAAPSPGAAAAGWLARQLADGDHLMNGPFPDPGLTADAVLAFDAAGVAQDSAVKATTWLAGTDVLAGYIGDGVDESYAGPLAKIALVAEAQSLDPAAFGGVDLITALKARQAPSGRYSDRTSAEDITNGITQALAVIALHRAGGAPQAGVDYLVGSQCPDGGFPLYLEQATCVSDVDTTGFAAQALLAVGRTVDSTGALDWLQGAQKSDGGFDSGGPTPIRNSNSTGLAAEALRMGGRTPAADRAVAFLTSLQVGCAAAEANRGTIAYDATGFNQGSAPRATAQAVPGIVGVSLAVVSNTGAVAGAPVLACDAPPTSSSPTPTTTTTTAVAAPIGEGTGPQLARTGFQPAPALALGFLLLLAGAAILLVVRRPMMKGGDQ